MTRRGWLLFVAMSVVWGIPYLMIKVAVEVLGPAELVFLRTGLAAVLLLPFALARREIGTTLRRWRPLLVYTAVEVAVPWLLLNDAERHVPSSVAGLVIAAVPVVAALLMLLLDRGDRLTAGRLVGLGLGLVGVALLLGVDVGAAGTSALPIVELLVVVVCYAVGPIVAARWLGDVPHIGLAMTSLAITAVVYVPFVAGDLPTLAGRLTPRSGLAVLGLAVVCTALAFLLFFALIAEIGPARSTVITFFNPVVAVALGALVLGERLTWATGVASVLILGGSVLATRRAARREPTTAAEPARAR